MLVKKEERPTCLFFYFTLNIKREPPKKEKKKKGKGKEHDEKNRKEIFSRISLPPLYPVC